MARRPDEIDMLEVVSTLEGPLSLVECLNGEDVCDRIDTCVARSVWMEVNQTVAKALKGITLAEVLRRYADATEVNNYVI